MNIREAYNKGFMQKLAEYDFDREFNAYMQRVTPRTGWFSGRKYYTVQPGDTLSDIAKLYNIPLNQLEGYNNSWFFNADRIRPYQPIYLEPPKSNIFSRIAGALGYGQN